MQNTNTYILYFFCFSYASSTSKPTTKAWGQDAGDTVQIPMPHDSDDPGSARSSVKEDAAVQTGGELLREFDPVSHS